MGQTLITPRDEFSAIGMTVSQHIMNRAQLSSFIDLLNQGYTTGDLGGLFENPLDSIVSVRVYPLDLRLNDWLTADTSGLAGGVAIGKSLLVRAPNFVVTGAFPKKLHVGTIDFFSTNEANLHFMYYSPLCRISLYLPYYGFVNLDTDTYMGKKIKILYVPDPLTGDCQIYAVDYANEKVYDIWHTTFGASVPISAVDYHSQELAKIHSLIGLGGAAMQVASGGGASGVLGTLSGAINGLQENRQAIGSVDTIASFMAPPDCYAIVERIKVEYPTGYYHRYGAPLMAQMTLSDVHGYGQVNNIITDWSIPNMLEDERTELVDLLQTGVYFPPAPVQAVADVPESRESEEPETVEDVKHENRDFDEK